MIEYEIIVLSEGVFANFWFREWTEIKTKQNREPTFSENKQALVLFREFEKGVKSNKHIKGWVAWVNHEYPEVKALLVRFGGLVYKEERNRTWFIKEF